MFSGCPPYLTLCKVHFYKFKMIVQLHSKNSLGSGNLQGFCVCAFFLSVANSVTLFPGEKAGFTRFGLCCYTEL